MLTKVLLSLEDIEFPQVKFNHYNTVHHKDYVKYYKYVENVIKSVGIPVKYYRKGSRDIFKFEGFEIQFDDRFSSGITSTINYTINVEDEHRFYNVIEKLKIRCCKVNLIPLRLKFSNWIPFEEDYYNMNGIYRDNINYRESRPLSSLAFIMERWYAQFIRKY